MLNDRLYKLKELLQSRPGIGMQDLMNEMEVAKATVKRDIEALRDRFDTPIVFDRFHGGYRIEAVKVDPSRRAVKRTELPGLWFSSDEAFALLTAQQLLTTIEPGMLGPKLKPLNICSSNGAMGCSARSGSSSGFGRKGFTTDMSRPIACICRRGTTRTRKPRPPTMSG